MSLTLYFFLIIYLKPDFLFYQSKDDIAWYGVIGYLNDIQYILITLEYYTDTNILG